MFGAQEKKRKQRAKKQQQSTTPRISSGINSDEKSNPTLLFSTKTQTLGTSFTLFTPPENSSRFNSTTFTFILMIVYFRHPPHYSHESYYAGFPLFEDFARLTLEFDYRMQERRCLLREFPELLSSDKYSKAEEVIDAADFVSGKHCYHPFPCDFSISGFLKRSAWDPCSEVILQKQDICLSDIHAVGITTSQDANSTCSISLIDENLFNKNGPIPDSFGDMISLTNLNLSYNHLEGGLPKSFAHLSHLRSLHLSRNNLTEELHKFFQKLSRAEDSLQVLYVDDNRLSELSVGFNQLSGFIPQNFGQLPSLVSRQLYGNQITGSPPDLSMFPLLLELDLGDNQLNGTMHRNIGKLSMLDLKYLLFSSNSSTCNFFSDWVPPFQLLVIMLSSCKLGSHFPKWLQPQNKIFKLDISSNGISDVPSWFWDLSPDLSTNQFMGPIPLVHPNVILLNLSKNKFSGSVYFLCAFTGMELTYLDLSNNLISGELPNCWEHFNSLYIFSLAYDNLYGEIPSSMGSLCELETLHLHNNGAGLDIWILDSFWHYDF
ncbi:hypothetical protein ACSBR2_007122 [Camellia fascicularis]